RVNSQLLRRKRPTTRDARRADFSIGSAKPTRMPPRVAALLERVAPPLTASPVCARVPVDEFGHVVEAEADRSADYPGYRACGRTMASGGVGGFDVSQTRRRGPPEISHA